MKYDFAEIALLIVTLLVVGFFVLLAVNAEPALCVDGKRKAVSIISKTIIWREVDCEVSSADLLR